MKRTLVTFSAAALLVLNGCGGGSSSSADDLAIDLPDEKTLVFYDTQSSSQYSYDTTSETYVDMNEDNATCNMIGKNGNLTTWNDIAAGDEKIIMLAAEYDFAIDGNVTFEDFYYLGHFHTEDNVQTFAAHGSSEFDPSVASNAKKATLLRFNAHLAEQEAIKTEIGAVLPVGESLCNFFVSEHTHESNATEEAAAHIALSTSGMIYVFEENEGVLESVQAPFGLDGVTECREDESSIIPYGDHGVLIFVAQSQKLYLVDNHGMDFHAHSTWNVDKFLPQGFAPTQMAGIGEGEDEHVHE
ncbi:MAG: hypothetical protein QG564_596 [Campylobacterota bacterium]|nr:hypothetical protein [Campylobacterota bacterium]